MIGRQSRYLGSEQGQYLLRCGALHCAHASDLRADHSDGPSRVLLPLRRFTARYGIEFLRLLFVRQREFWGLLGTRRAGESRGLNLVGLFPLDV